MDNNTFDDKLKSIAKKEKSHIPESLRKRVNETYDIIYKEKGHKVVKAKYKYLKVASVLIVALLGVNIVMPTLAESIPILGEVFKVLNENLGITTEYSKYGVEVKKSMKIDEDEMLIIKSVAYDGIEVAIFYEVSSLKPLKGDNYYLSAMFGGRNIGGYGGSCWGSKSNDNLFYGIASYQIDFGGNTLKSPEKLKLLIEEVSVDNDNGKRIFMDDSSFEVKLDSTKYPTIEKELNKRIKTDVGDIEIHEIYLTGLNLGVTTTMKLNGSTDDYGIGFYMIDEEAGPLTDQGGIGDSKGRIRKSMFYSKVTEKAIGKVSFIPYIRNYSKIEKDKENNSIVNKEELSANNGGTLGYGEKGTIEFEPMIFENGKGYLNIKTTGMLMFEHVALISVDKSGEEQHHWGVVRNETYDNGKYEYTLEFDKLDENIEYTYIKYDNSDDTDILEEHIFEVDFTN